MNYICSKDWRVLGHLDGSIRDNNPHGIELVQ